MQSSNKKGHSHSVYIQMNVHLNRKMNRFGREMPISIFLLTPTCASKKFWTFNCKRAGETRNKKGKKLWSANIHLCLVFRWIFKLKSTFKFPYFEGKSSNVLFSLVFRWIFKLIIGVRLKYSYWKIKYF